MKQMTLGQLAALLDAAEDRLKRGRHDEQLERAVEKLRDGLVGRRVMEQRKGDKKRGTSR